MATKQIKVPKVYIDYDKRADVLYITLGKTRPGISVEVDDWIHVTVDPYTDDVVGITIIDFKERYMSPKLKSIEKSARTLIPTILNNFRYSH